MHRKIIYKHHKLTYKRFNQRKSERGLRGEVMNPG